MIIKVVLMWLVIGLATISVTSAIASISYLKLSAETPDDAGRFLNSAPTNTQEVGAGDFIATWQDDQDNNGIWQILARGFKRTSAEHFADITVNSVGAGQQRDPTIAVAENGDFVVTWEDDNDGNGVYQILARGFNSDGTERFADITVNSVGAGQQFDPAIAMADNGDFVVAWEDDNDGNGVFQILARGFSSDGTERFPDITVNTVGAGQQFDPAIAMADNGDFVVAWEDDNDGNGVFQILARGFNSDGTERFPDITVNSVGAGQQRNPTIAMVRRNTLYLPMVLK